ncbi:MAG TPA: SEC-C metal-binding domain-containing protein [Planctomycetota bacterium]|nr:SEC-C metal-binding domain-containing protein [Planctomycetota bacterium]
MPERTLESRWRLLAASFVDAPAGREAAARFGDGFRPALDLVAYALAHDVAQPPRELDGEHVRELTATVLPGRVVGDERWRGDLPDVLADFLGFVASEEALTTQSWEWTRAVDAARPAFAAALKNPARARFGAATKQAPDRRQAPKLGRNDPCFCGSGRKYKHCCWKLT